MCIVGASSYGRMVCRFFAAKLVCRALPSGGFYSACG